MVVMTFQAMNSTSSRATSKNVHSGLYGEIGEVAHNHAMEDVNIEQGDVKMAFSVTLDAMLEPSSIQSFATLSVARCGMVGRRGLHVPNHAVMVSKHMSDRVSMV